MFSASLERVLNLAAREAMVRRHADLTIEHLLFAAAHDPEGEEILEASGADVPRLRRELAEFLEQTMQRLPPNSRRPPQQTLAFRRVLQTAVVHVQSAGKDEAGVGDMLAALMRETRSHAVELLSAQGVTRLDVLNFISHGVRKAPPREGDGGEPMPAGDRDEEERTARDPLSAYASNLTERAREGKLDPVIGRAREMSRALEVLCRRRKNNPVFVGEPGVGKTAIVEGLAQRLIQEDSPEALAGAEIFGLDTGALLAGTRYRGDFRTPCEMKFSTSRRVTPCALSSSTACERVSRMSAASMSPTPASSLPALCTCTTAVWSTRRNASVCCGGRRELGGRRCIVCSRNSASSRRRRGTSAPEASRISSPSGSWAAANSRCSIVRSAWRRTIASRAARFRTRSREALNTLRPPRSPRAGGSPRRGRTRAPPRPWSRPPRRCRRRKRRGRSCAPPS